MLITAPMGKTGNLTVGKLFTESVSEDKINSQEANGEWYLEGIFMQGDVLNSNKRVYPTSILDSAIDHYTKNRINNKTSWGNLNHPDSPKIDLANAAILTNQLTKKGSDYYGRAKVCHEDCPMGKILRGLLKTGGRVGVSSRGLGTSNEAKWKNEEACDLVDHFILRAVDVVADPSAPEAMVNAIREEKTYVLDDSTGEIVELNEETYHLFEENLKIMPVKQEDQGEKVFQAIKNFLNSLK